MPCRCSGVPRLDGFPAAAPCSISLQTVKLSLGEVFDHVDGNVGRAGEDESFVASRLVRQAFHVADVVDSPDTALQVEVVDLRLEQLVSRVDLVKAQFEVFPAKRSQTSRMVNVSQNSVRSGSIARFLKV